MDTVCDLRNCTGCGACYYSCPLHCIKMNENSEGFLYPVVNRDKCIECNKCLNICQVNNPFKTSSKKAKCYAAWNTNDEARLDSSSGGLFTAVAENILNKNGVVYAVKMEDNYDLHHVRITKPSQLETVRRSKYYQSRAVDVFESIKTDLSNEVKVMFIGTPCQVAAIKKLFECDNLITIDLVCHGVASKKVVLDYIKSMEVKFNANIKKIIFRHKTARGGE